MTVGEREAFDVSLQGGVATLTLRRPEVRNALDSACLTALAQEFRRLGSDPSVEVLVLSGADPAFCAGLDLGELATDRARLMAVATDPATNPWLALAEMPQPVVGAVNGPAVTGGLELALACDILIASERAAFSDTHARVGVLPAQGGPARLSAVVGAQVAKYLSYTGDAIDAKRALALGLVSRVVPHERLMAEAIAMAQRIREGNLLAVRRVKQSYDTGLLGDRRSWLEFEAAQSARWQRGCRRGET